MDTSMSAWKEEAVEWMLIEHKLTKAHWCMIAVQRTVERLVKVL